MAVELQIREDFQRYIPPLQASERAGLEAKIRTEGCRDALLAWRSPQGAVLIDGHNRLAICGEYGIPYRVDLLDFDDEEHVLLWIIDHQLARRNVTDDQRGMLTVKRIKVQAEIAKRERAKAASKRSASVRGDDKRAAVLALLNDPAWSTRSDRAIARECGCSQPFVSGLRQEVKASLSADVSDKLIITPPPTAKPKPDGAAKKDTRKEVAAEAKVSERKVRTCLALEAADPALAEQVLSGTLSLASATREVKKREVVERLESVEVREAKAIAGVYDVIVIDPPWPMQKIERDERPNQVAFDYPTMSEDELRSLAIPAADDAHVWLWTTHKFLPMALRLLDAWGLAYVCTFVWHKPGGFQPIGLPQYNCEFALYARKGSPSFVSTKAFPTCFEASRGAHSEKPEAFYEVVRRVTAGRRIDMFNRRAIDGFDGWGKEAA